MLTCEEVAMHLRESALRCEPELSAIVVAVCEWSAVLAKAYIGHPQDGWDDLSSATTQGFRHHYGFWIPGKLELGYGSEPDFDPLLRTGKMRDSIEIEADGLIGIVGSREKTALWQELGTEGADYPIPPRPFLAKAVMEAVPAAEMLLEELVVSLLVPGRS